MRTFKFRTWSGCTQTVQAEYVKFHAHHVVFYNQPDPRYEAFLVLAEGSNNVRELREVPSDDDQAATPTL